MKIIAIVQARMGSTRLPGKVLMDVEGKPMLWHLIERLKYSKKIDEIVIAIPDTKENDILEKFAEENNVKYYRGSEDDVLSRYYEAAEKFKADVIVRVTSDCPLIDPKIVDKIIERYAGSKADFTANFLEGKKGEVIKKTFPKGLEAEIFAFLTLKKVKQEAKERYQQEHVDPYIFENPDIFSLSIVENKEDFSYMRWTVDDREDLQFVREIYKRIYPSKKMFYMEDVISLLKKFPELLDINKDVKHKLA